MAIVGRQIAAVAVLTFMLGAGLPAEAGVKGKSGEQIRAEYLERVTQTAAPAEIPLTGSLWTPGGKFANLAADYKASHLNDTIIIQVVQQTTATAAGTTNTQRTFATSSAVTAVPTYPTLSKTNPLFGANSASTLKGQGQVASSSAMQTSLAGRVIAVLPSGDLVVEAQRSVLLNHERETAVVRGVVRPGDIGPDNTVLSTALGNLEIELKGKGVISDATRPPNVFMRTLQWLFGF
jgi:flagellar L-ring protein precursor FlgH